ncbi:MAG: Uma2 family endonuclease [Planctomycetaceae bacterium]|nr:Uma2 family endonuclease [Planctomycetaceae bacterium]
MISISRLRFDPADPLTDRAFMRLCRANPDLRLERTAGGELIVMTPAGADSSGRNLKIAGRLYVWSEANELGITFDSSAGFTLPNGAIRSPDASWIVRARWEALTPEDRQGFAPICPDFVVELRSPADRLRDLRAKMAEYRIEGARLGWLIDPKRKMVEIYRPRRRVEVLTVPAALSGEDVLPGFVLDLKGILEP